MNGSPSVVVNKGGFFSAVAKGLFGTIMVFMICVTVVGVFALRTLDRHTSDLVNHVFEALPEWQAAMPPAIADALRDRSAPDYRGSIVLEAQVVPQAVGEMSRVVITATNKGSETVSLLAVRTVIEDANGVPIDERAHYLATPLSIDCDWPGRMYPDSPARRFGFCTLAKGGAKVAVEITDLRVATAEETPEAPVPATAAALPAPEAP